MKKIYSLLNWLSNNQIKFVISIIENDKSGEIINYLIETETLRFRTFEEGHKVYILLHDDCENHSVDFNMDELSKNFKEYAKN